jgi:glycosyltransferase involved in cell wall biosynthesis
MPTKIVVLGAYAHSVVSFRGDLINLLAAAGRKVIVMTSATSPEIAAEIESLGQSNLAATPSAAAVASSSNSDDTCQPGVSFRSYPLERSGLSPLADLGTLSALRAAFRELQPQVILAYTIKPIIWGAVAARVVPRARFVSMVTGLGYAFQGESLKRRLLNILVVLLYRFALKRADIVIFQNPDNRDEFLKRSIIRPEKCHVVNGSGINLARFEPTPLQDGPPHFLLIARLLGEKGIREFAAAAKAVKLRHPESVFSLVGPTDPSPDGISLSEVEAWAREGTIVYHGETRDVRPFIRSCHVYCLPSYHEGMPRSVLEAMAMARPILTTDVCGCRETVTAGENGWLVPKADPQALTEKMLWFIENRSKWEKMAGASRRLAEDRFDVQKVNAEMLRLLEVGS